MADTKDKNEYNRLVKEKISKQNQYNSCKARIEENEYLLKRLRSVKETVAEQKKAFKQIKKDDKNTIKDKYSWKGSNYNDFKSKGADLLDEDERYYKHSIDYVLDSLNNEITRIENEILKEYGLLGRLGSAINSLTNKIVNFFN